MIQPLLRVLLAGLVVLVLSLPGGAQEAEGPTDIPAFNTFADTAQATLATPTVSTAELDELRRQLTDWRAALLEAENVNADRIATLRSQIEALGPAPEEGATEPEEIAARRQQLNTELADAELPRVNATEAYNRADGLISEIDATIRARQTQALQERVPTPLNPAHWPTAASDFGEVAAIVREEISTNLSGDRIRDRLRDNAPRTLAIVAVGLLLLLRAPVWTDRLTDRIENRRRRRGRATLAFLVSLTQIALPVAGVMLFVLAFLSTGIPGETTAALLRTLIGFLATTFTALWLAGRLFPRDEKQPDTFSLTPERRRSARRTMIFTGVLAGLNIVLNMLVALDQVSPASHGVLLLPFHILLGLTYLQASRLIRAVRKTRAEETEDYSPSFLGRLVGLLGQALGLVAFAGPALAAAGYVNAAEWVMVPTALTMGLLALFVALQPPIRDAYALISDKSLDEADNALVPVLVNFVLVFAAAPALALIWGMRPTELLEVYARFAEGFSFGDTRITPSTIVTVIVVFLLILGLTRVLQSALKSTVLPRTKMDVGAQNALSSGIGYIGIAIAALLAVNAGGIDLTALAFILSALSVGIGFGLQNVVQNFVSGIILLIERPIGEGDWIEVGGNMGIVKSISVRSTTIETFDKQQLIVPNGDFISGTVTNWTRGSPLGRATITVGVAYGTDTRRVQSILHEIAASHPEVMTFPEPGVDFLGFGADSLDFRIRAMLYDVNHLLSVTTEIHHLIAERFAAENIEIPFAQRDLWLRNPEALAAAPKADAPKPEEAPRAQPKAESPSEPRDGDLAQQDNDGDR
ncbi:Small-conductance mechanosensitive channel [Poseidonocella pacifica]|uniref:Small-conductance mechanosensitive channel n=1 Tax=Poseidonocella pacifica TaxID=871651 RepID=A0A1I0XAQ7_9RHOB|nr:DUF3772 domain-containing protein [Poseidonocella pacifica]SFA98095.1 Small-conductance mechanosensitive channel [Poseidonocella pacifica]